MDAKIIVILLSIISIVYSICLNLYKRKSALNPIPENVKDVYDAETYGKWRSYHAENSRVDLISACVAGIINLVLLLFNVYSEFASLFPKGIAVQTFAVILLDIAVSTVVSITFSYYSTMVIEQKYGFNKSTIKTFIADKIRGFIVSSILSFAIAYLMLGLHTWLGNYIIILFAVVLFLFTMVITFLYPYLSRISNKFTPLDDGELREKLMELLTSHGYRVREIQVMDASRRTTKLNAYFTGLGSTKTIVLYDNLVNTMSTDEICAVFAHELGHGLNKDVTKQQILNIGNMLLMAVAVWFSIILTDIHTGFGFDGLNYGFAYVITSVFLSIIQPFCAIVTNAYSRRCEYRADAQAITEGYGSALISALKKLALENFAELAPTRVSVVLEYSHPPLADRISAIEKKISEKTE